MIVQVKISRILADRYPQSGCGNTNSVQLPDGAKFGDLLRKLELSEPGKLVVVRDGKVQRADSLLKDGDYVTILPLVEGG